MPFLRVIRDKRGYETTYLMHWYRDGQRQRTRILYVFRSPGGVRVGRQVLEPEVMRQLEAQHPDIDFDWSVVRENKQVIESSPEPRRRPRRGEGENGARPAQPGASARQQPGSRTQGTSGSGDALSEDQASASTRRRPNGAADADGRQPAAGGAPQPARPPIPSSIEATTLDGQIAFLGEWYPQIRDRIMQRAADESRREALLALAERLNTESWTGADLEQITARLQQAGEALERLAHLFSRRRRRTRRRPGDAATTADPAAAAQPAADDDPEPDAQLDPTATEPPPSES